jgi:hypothetical protein
VVRHFDLDVFELEDMWASKKEIQNFNGLENPNILERIIFKLKRSSGNYPLLIQKGHEFNREVINDSYRNLCVIGRWQSEAYFNDNKELIKSIFDLKNFIANDYSKAIANQMKESKAVTIQVRRGDYISNPIYAKSLGGLSKNYYIHAIKLLENKLGSDINYFFISDDIDWCRNNFSNLTNVHFVEQEKSKSGYLSDFWLLTQSKHSIISNSTFSWWGAWLSEKANSIIVAPKKWSREPNESDANCVPQRWIRIDNDFEPI